MLRPFARLCAVSGLLSVYTVVLIGISSPAFAATGAIQLSESIDSSVKELGQTMTKQMETTETTVKNAGDTIAKAIIQQHATTALDDMSSSLDPDVARSISSLPMGNMVIDQIIQDVMDNRLHELNNVPYSKGGVPKETYLVDPTRTNINVDAQIFEIFMLYFCDPKGRNGDYATLSIETTKGKLGCGKADYASNSRDSLISQETNAGARDIAFNQIVGLPTKPATLFFDPITFPAKRATADQVNTSPLAPVYYGAFAQAMHFLVGKPGDIIDLGRINTGEEQRRYVESQGNVARQMLASYPFAVLFAERMGTLGPDAAIAAAEIMKNKLGAATTQEPISARIEDLEKQKNISMAEYMDILMYQIPMSSGYISKVSTLNSAQLARERVWLEAMQTALNYQRNRWLEIATALEAVR